MNTKESLKFYERKWKQYNHRMSSAVDRDVKLALYLACRAMRAQLSIASVLCNNKEEESVLKIISQTEELCQIVDNILSGGSKSPSLDVGLFLVKYSEE